MKSDTWLTPPEILRELGAFDLDPCCPPAMPWPTAARMIAPPKDGLSEPWTGRVWLNPPFGNRAAAWLAKLAEHGNGVALIPARTETRMFYSSVWPKADAVLFLRGRPHFHRADGTRAAANSGAPIALVAYGEENARILAGCGLGVCVHWSNVARVSGDAGDCRRQAHAASAEPALLGGASPTGNAGEAAPHWADAKRPPSAGHQRAAESGTLNGLVGESGGGQ